MSPAGEECQGPFFLKATLGGEPHCKPFMLGAEPVGGFGGSGDVVGFLFLY